MIISALKVFEDNYIWYFTLKNQKIVLIDPGSSQEIIDFCTLNNIEPAAILVTHKHPDHIGGIPDLLSKYPEVKIYGPEKSYQHYFHFPLKEGDEFKITDYHFQFWETPGHTIDHGIYWLRKEAVVFTGDTLFSLGCGRIFDGSFESLHHSLQRIRSELSEQSYQIFPTHEYTLSNLEFLRQNSADRDSFEKLKTTILGTWNPQTGSLPSSSVRELKYNAFLNVEDFHNFKTLRLARNQWKGIL